ncbi:MAG TPA: hypothetical protein VG166_09015 [Caulobacteraceae bacterium]|jgi:uncharacterized membrane-anchored protein|nr:hypothetical protein [Caulobacteraceae bacterium]
MSHGQASGGAAQALSKVPQATLVFWIVKICATTVGETGGDALSMTLNLGYAVSTLIFLGFFAVTLTAQVAAKRFHPLIYWLVVVATTTVGTTTSDYLDRTAGLGYPRASALLFAGVVAILAAWRLTTGAIRSDKVYARRDEVFYWLTILVSNTLGTALGDFTADSAGLGFEGGALIFAGLLVLVAAAFFLTRIPRAILFWAAYVLTRPLGATLGDVLTKPHAIGGLALGRFASTFTIAAVMVIIVVATSRAMPWVRRTDSSA